MLYELVVLLEKLGNRNAYFCCAVLHVEASYAHPSVEQLNNFRDIVCSWPRMIKQKLSYPRVQVILHLRFMKSIS